MKRTANFLAKLLLFLFFYSSNFRAICADHLYLERCERNLHTSRDLLLRDSWKQGMRCGSLRAGDYLKKKGFTGKGGGLLRLFPDTRPFPFSSSSLRKKMRLAMLDAPRFLFQSGRLNVAFRNRIDQTGFLLLLFKDAPCHAKKLIHSAFSLHALYSSASFVYVGETNRHTFSKR